MSNVIDDLKAFKYPSSQQSRSISVQNLISSKYNRFQQNALSSSLQCSPSPQTTPYFYGQHYHLISRQVGKFYCDPQSFLVHHISLSFTCSCSELLIRYKFSEVICPDFFQQVRKIIMTSQVVHCQLIQSVPRKNTCTKNPQILMKLINVLQISQTP